MSSDVTGGGTVGVREGENEEEVTTNRDKVLRVKREAQMQNGGWSTMQRTPEVYLHVLGHECGDRGRHFGPFRHLSVHRWSSLL